MDPRLARDPEAKQNYLNWCRVFRGEDPFARGQDLVLEAVESTFNALSPIMGARGNILGLQVFVEEYVHGKRYQEDWPFKVVPHDP